MTMELRFINFLFDLNAGLIAIRNGFLEIMKSSRASVGVDSDHGREWDWRYPGWPGIGCLGGSFWGAQSQRARILPDNHRH